MTDAIRCSRCEQHLDPEAFAPTHRKSGDWCRACRKAYMAGYNAKRYEPERIARASAPRTCKRCQTTFTRWDTYSHPGSAATHCRPCYNAKARERSGRQPRKPKPMRLYGKAQGAAWDALRAQVHSEETHCWICNEYVDQTLHGHDRLGPTVDHVIPTALGGPNTRDNLRLAHRSCNSARGDARDERIKYLRLALAMSEKI
jgi:5-methylcytosine-specific restriction endonuclease McrA